MSYILYLLDIKCIFAQGKRTERTVARHTIQKNKTQLLNPPDI